MMDSLCIELRRLLPELDAYYRDDDSEDDDKPEQGLPWTGDEKGFIARIEGKHRPVVYTVTPCNFRGDKHFEATCLLLVPDNIDTMSVRLLSSGYGKSLSDPTSGRTLNPVPTAAEAKAQCEADYARRREYL